MSCPKCDEVQPEADACRACGLRADRFEEYSDRVQAGASDELEARWQAVEEAWDDDDAHDAFVEAAAAESAFALAARRYRLALRERPGDARAEARLERLRRMAEATLLSSAVARKKADTGPEPYKGAAVLLIVLLFLGVAAGAFYLLISGQMSSAP